MGLVNWIVIILGAAAALAVVIAFVMVRRHPENLDGKEHVADRPAGPGAEGEG